LRKEGKEIIFTNVGNPHALGAKPLSYIRQVCGCGCGCECGSEGCGWGVGYGPGLAHEECAWVQVIFWVQVRSTGCCGSCVDCMRACSFRFRCDKNHAHLMRTFSFRTNNKEQTSEHTHKQIFGLEGEEVAVFWTHRLCTSSSAGLVPVCCTFFAGAPRCDQHFLR